MASGKQHNAATVIMGLACLPVNPLVGVGVLATLGISPDLDLPHSKPQRLMLFTFLPYAYLIKHRSPLSHFPIIGTAGRIAYLGIIYFALAYAGVIPVSYQIMLAAFVQAKQTELLYVLAGLEAGACLHYAMDVIWSKAKRIRRRRR